jgi:hypothetical protein
MLKHTVLPAMKLFITVALTSCSNMQATKIFESPNKWFKLTYPADWQVEYEEGIYTFTATSSSNWAFQVSAYRATDGTTPNFSVREEFQRTVKSHPTAEIVALSNHKAVYYTESRGKSLLYVWITGGKRCKTFCSYTSDLPAPQSPNFTAAQKAVDSIEIQ